jgi:hypothetical protein
MERRIPAPHYSTLLQIEDSEQAFMFNPLIHENSWALHYKKKVSDIPVMSLTKLSLVGKN